MVRSIKSLSLRKEGCDKEGIVKPQSHYLYDVCFTPKWELIEGSLNKARVIQYAPMFSSERFTSYLKVYNETKSARCCKEEIPITHVKTDVLVNKVHDKKVVVPEILVDRAMQPSYFYDHIIELDEYYAPEDTTNFTPEIIPELAKTEFFIKVLQHEIGKTYKIGHIKFPDEYRHPYSVYGCSMNDVYIMHKENYRSAGVLNFQNKISEVEEEELDCDEIGYEAKGGTTEFKNPQTYAIQQTIKEMLRASGDLVAKVLMEWKIVDVPIIYGLAASHSTKRARLLQLTIDFNENTACSIVVFKW